MSSIRSFLLVALAAGLLALAAPGENSAQPPPTKPPKQPPDSKDSKDSKDIKATPGDKQPTFPTEIDGKKLDDFTPGLRNPDPSIREKTIRKIVLFGPPAAVTIPLILRRFEDQDAGV